MIKRFLSSCGSLNVLLLFALWAFGNNFPLHGKHAFSVSRPLGVARTVVFRNDGFCFTISYLVDPASSYMLVTKIKPCTFMYKFLYDETANGSFNRL